MVMKPEVKDRIMSHEHPVTAAIYNSKFNQVHENSQTKNCHFCWQIIFFFKIKGPVFFFLMVLIYKLSTSFYYVGGQCMYRICYHHVDDRNWTESQTSKRSSSLHIVGVNPKVD